MQLQTQLSIAPAKEAGAAPPFPAEQERYYARRVWRPSPEGRYCFVAPGQADTLSVFREMVRFSYENGIDIRFAINPVHARMIYAIQQIGLWPTYEDWKRGLVSVIEEEAAAAKATPYPLWDFSGINSVTTEHIPESLFWEPSHYKSSAGDIMLDRILDHNEGRALPDDFGMRLTSSSIESWIEHTREGLRAYVQAQPDEANVVQATVAPIMEVADGSNCGMDMRAVITGSEALRAGDTIGAESAFARAQALHDAEVARYAALSVPFMEKGFAAALRDARAGKPVERRLADWIAYQTRGNARVSAKLYAEAIDDFGMAIKLGPPNTALYYLRGTTRMLVGAYDGALDDFNQGLLLDPTNKTLQALRDQATLQTGRIPVAKP